MRRFNLKSAVFAIAFACLAGCASSARAEQLFDGKSLDGWRHYLADHAVTMSDVWSVQDGILVCKGEPMGYLYTAKPYRNYRLTVEWRWAPGKKPGNSGVLLRINGKPAPLPRCYEAQLQSGNAGDFYGFHGMKMTGDPARTRTITDNPMLGEAIGVRKITAAENEPGQWNVYVIDVHDDTIKATINGKLVNEVSGAEVLAGPIALQSEGAEIHFRKVEIAEMRE